MANEEERAAVDAILGLPDSGWRGGERDANSSFQDSGGRELRENRHLLLPLLHAIQKRMGWISHGALNYLCSRLSVPPAEAYGVASFYALFSMEKSPRTIVHVCDDIACKLQGADSICSRLESEFDASGDSEIVRPIGWKRSPCLGLCEQAPAIFVQTSGANSQDCTVAPATVEVALALLNGEPSEKRRPGKSTPQQDRNSLKLLARVGEIDPLSLQNYLRRGGYGGLRKAIEIGAEAVVSEVSLSRLAGRGGAAFPTGVKWKAVSGASEQPHYVVCNADESEPGTFKDRVLMEEDPFSVIEAFTIAGFACRAKQGYLYLRGEYPEAALSLQNAIDSAEEAGYLGSGIFGSEFEFHIEIRRGAGAYICGEETALLESIEGKRGEPRNKPPFPAQVGLFGKPTAINNVETLLNVIPIVRDGGENYAAIGSGSSTGTRLFCLSGCVEAPGVYEIPYGGTLGSLLELAGGVKAGRKLQAILLGGAAGVFVRPDELDIPLTLEGARAANATLGSGVVMVFDDTVDMRAILLRIASFFRDESCGQCVPCRVGTVRQEEALHRLLSGTGSAGADLALLDELDRVMRDASICGLGQTASSAILSAIKRLGIFEGGAT